MSTDKDETYASIIAMNTKRSRDEGLDLNNGEKKVKTDGKTETGEDGVIEVRVLITNYEAGVVIGKGGSNVKTIREKSSAFISILKSEGDAKDRVMNVKGTVDNCSTAISLIIQLLLEDKSQKDLKEAEQAGTVPSAKSDAFTLKLLAHKFLTGCIIGKGGQIVKQIATELGARVQVSGETMPGSTEKTVSITGTPTAIHQALLRILSQIRDNPVRPGGSSVLFVPGRMVYSSMPTPFYPGAPATPYPTDPSLAYGVPEYDPLAGAYGAYPTQVGGPESTQKIAIPTVCAGSVIGKGGTIVADIKAQSGCQIRIADPEQTNPTERVVTVTGPAAGIQTAVYLIRQRVEQPYGTYASTSFGGDGAESTQKVAIPTICAGAVIGKGGTIIADIKAQSGCQIRIADPEPSTPNERVVTVTGSAAGIQTAVYLIRQRVEQPYSQYGGFSGDLSYSRTDVAKDISTLDTL